MSYLILTHLFVDSKYSIYSRETSTKTCAIHATGRSLVYSCLRAVLLMRSLRACHLLCKPRLILLTKNFFRVDNGGGKWRQEILDEVNFRSRKMYDEPSRKWGRRLLLFHTGWDLFHLIPHFSTICFDSSTPTSSSSLSRSMTSWKAHESPPFSAHRRQ